MQTIEEIKEKIAPILAAHNVTCAVLFGSQAIGTATQESDFDIAILFKTGTITDTLSRYGEILRAISEALSLPQEKIDLADLRLAPLLLKYQIATTGKLLYGDPYRYELFKLASIREYHDADDLRELERTIIYKRQVLLAQ